MHFQNDDLTGSKYSFKYFKIFSWFSFRNVQNVKKKLSICINSQKLQLMIAEYKKLSTGICLNILVKFLSGKKS